MSDYVTAWAYAQLCIQSRKALTHKAYQYTMKNDSDPLDRPIDFSATQRGPVTPVEPGKQRISIRLHTRIIRHFKAMVQTNGGGSYQQLINDALLEHIERNTHGERYKREELQQALAEALKQERAA